MKYDYRSYAAFLLIGIIPSIFTILMYQTDPAVFTAYFGKIHPFLALGIVLLVGIISLRPLLRNGWIICPESGALKKGAFHLLFVVGFTLPAIGLDLLGVFPEDINVPFPAAILFYVSMGFVVEVLFHLFPMALLLGLNGVIKRPFPFTGTVSRTIFWTAFLEPCFQGFLGIREGYSLWSMFLLALSLYAFNRYQLMLFRRYGFLNMYGARLVYYLVWHIVWGEFRHVLLF